MANGVKEYKIVINGIQESVNAVESLNKQLNDLEQRMNALNSKGVNISTPKGGGSYKGELDAQEKLEKQILETEEKLAQVRDENYKKLLHMKEELKEYTQIAKSQVAAESNAQGLYDTNTMAGMKASLKSIKAEMQTVEIGGDRFQELTRQANELNNKLKEIEQSYGQFGRNVGNYAEGVAEGMTKVKVDINGITEEFDTAKQAMKSLRTEMQTLSTKKDMGLISEAEEERLKGLIPVVKQLESSIADAGKPMDALLDTMQSVMAIASVGQGIGALFGMDDSEIEKTIQKLVALQNVMQGIQVLQQQMQSGEGIGGLLAKGSDMIDKMVTSMMGYTTATKGATVATRALGTALKAIGIGLVIALVAELIDMYKQWSDEQNKAIEEAEAAQEKLRKSIEQTRDTYVSASASYANAASRLSHLRAEYMATNDELKKTAILEQATEQFKSLGIEVSGVADAQRILVQQGDKVIEMIRLQGDAAAIAALRMEAFKKSFNMLIENGYDALGASILAGSNKTVQELDKRQDEIQGQLSKLGKELGVGAGKAAKSVTKSVTKATVDGVKELNELRIAAMKDGLLKTIAQLEEERRQKIAKIRKDGVMVGELELATNALYDKKIEDEKKKHAENLEKVYKDMYSNILRLQKENADRQLEIEQNNENHELEKLKRRSNMVLNQGVSSYGVQGKKQLTPSTRNSLGIISQNNTEFVNDARKRIEMYRDMLTAQNNYSKQVNDRNRAVKEYYNNNIEFIEDTNKKLAELEKEREWMFDDEYQKQKTHLTRSLEIVEEERSRIEAEHNGIVAAYEEYYLELKGQLDEYDDYISKKYSEEEQKEVNRLTDMLLVEETYSRDLSQMFTHRLSTVEAYWSKRLEVTNNNINAINSAEIEAENARYETEKDQLGKEHNERMDALHKWAKDRKEYIEAEYKDEKEKDDELTKLTSDYTEKIKELTENRKKEVEQIEELHTQKIEAINQKKNDNLIKENEEYYEELLQNLRDYQSAISNLESKQPVKNAWGFLNIKETNKNNREILSAYETLAQTIIEKKRQLDDNFRYGLINKETYESTMRELDNFTSDLGDKMDKVKYELSFSASFEKIAGEIDQYLQYLGQSLNQLMRTLWDYQDAEYSYHIEQLDKQIDEYEKLLEKQKDIIEKYSDEVDDIEDELSSSRGDRRQHLIDQLNAEISAQRAAMAEEKKIEKQKKALEEKKEKEEEDQRKREHQRQVTQAFINWHLSVANALTTQPFMPVGIAMGALATALGAAQYALVKSQKYADGGVIQGKSHKDGGVKVLGGRAEVEGGEFITNKRTTEQNIDLLEYINKKKRRVDLNDLIEFYSSGKVKKNINKMSPTRYLADGGYIPPTLNNDIDIDNRILSAIESYSKKPTVVQVVDIVDKMDNLKNVQVLAGLTPSY
ncbi:MAG: hypothetical protein J6S67_06365 [Methanobrevibacter sp.]|nr:hypothetical protein [Methanobrevibacter sp.]